MAEDTVSREAHERIAKERDDLKAQVAELRGVVKDYGLRERAISHLQSKGVQDAGRWASLALPHLRELEDLEQVASTVDQLFGDGLTAVVQPPPAPDTDEKEPATPPPPSPFGTPNPAAGGGDIPSPQAIKPGSAEWKQVLKEKGMEGLKALDREGRVEWTSENLRWQGLQTS